MNERPYRISSLSRWQSTVDTLHKKCQLYTLALMVYDNNQSATICRQIVHDMDKQLGHLNKYQQYRYTLCKEACSWDAPLPYILNPESRIYHAILLSKRYGCGCGNETRANLKHRLKDVIDDLHAYKAALKKGYVYDY